MDIIDTSAFNAALIDLIHQVVEQELKDREAPAFDILEHEHEINDLIHIALSGASISINL